MSDLENMIEAVKQGDRESIRALLESDNRLANQRDESGTTPLMLPNSLEQSRMHHLPNA
jgi:ankyrin repeat protein